MKFRMGFVSNSSSTSYVILLPKDIDVKKLSISVQAIARWEEQMEWERDKGTTCPPHVPRSYSRQESEEAIRRIIADYIARGPGQYWDEQETYNCIIEEALKDYVIAEISGGSDSGGITLVEENKVLQILNR